MISPVSRILPPYHSVLEDAEVTNFCSTSLEMDRVNGSTNVALSTYFISGNKIIEVDSNP